MALQTEILALRHQVLVLQRVTHGRRLRLKVADRVFLGLVVSSMEKLEAASANHKTRDNHRLEPQGIPAVQDIEESSTEWPPPDRTRCSRSDPKDDASGGLQECFPGLRRRSAGTDYMLGYGGFTNINAELKQFSVNCRCAQRGLARLITTSDGLRKNSGQSLCRRKPLYAVARFQAPGVVNA